jgi:hypothetical protein
LLLLDFDSAEAYRDFPMRARFLARWLGLVSDEVNYRERWADFRVKRRRTARGWHVVVYYPAELVAYVPPLQIVALQALLGSDWKREGFNLVRVLNLKDAPEAWQTRWNVLYTQKFGAVDFGVRDNAPPAVHSPESVQGNLAED